MKRRVFEEELSSDQEMLVTDIDSKSIEVQ